MGDEAGGVGKVAPSGAVEEKETETTLEDIV